MISISLQWSSINSFINFMISWRRLMVSKRTKNKEQRTFYSSGVDTRNPSRLRGAWGVMYNRSRDMTVLTWTPCDGSVPSLRTYIYERAHVTRHHFLKTCAFVLQRLSLLLLDALFFIFWLNIYTIPLETNKIK